MLSLQGAESRAAISGDNTLAPRQIWKLRNKHWAKWRTVRLGALDNASHLLRRFPPFANSSFASILPIGVKAKYCASK